MAQTKKFKAPTTTCRIFVSRKTSDNLVSKMRRDKLMKWAANLEFFDAAKIEPGANWRKTIRDELYKANIFFLVLTNPARDDFDWPLYEAGLFESLEEEDRRRIICIYADSNDGPPDQLGDIQGVRATEPEILGLLMKLFHDKDFSLTREALNTRLTEEDLRPIAGEIAADISGGKSDRISDREYANKFIQLLIAPGADSLGDDTEVRSEKDSLGPLFGLRKKPLSGRWWAWGEIAGRVVHSKDPAGFNRRWTRQLAEIVSALKRGDDIQQLTGRFLAADGKLYRPEIEVYRTYENGSMTVDVTFSEQVQDSWLGYARPPVALAANLSLASRVRHELIEPYLRKISHWRAETSIEEGCAELIQLVEDVEHDGYYIAQLTKHQLQEAFDEDDTDELGELQHEYATDIRPFLGKALKEREIPELRQALKRWKKNNLRFLDIGLRTYARMLRLAPIPERHVVAAVKARAA